MLPKINNGIKSYVWFFVRKYEKQKKPYSVQAIKNNRLKIDVLPIEGCPYKKLILYIEFDNDDNVCVAFDTDDQLFYTSVFYIEVIRKKRINEAWKIISNRYKSELRIEKFIHFLLNAPTTIIELYK